MTKTINQKMSVSVESSTILLNVEHWLNTKDEKKNIETDNVHLRRDKHDHMFRCGRG